MTGDVHGRAEYGPSRFAFKNWPLGRTLTPVSYTHLLSSSKLTGQKIVLCHYPIADWQGMSHGSWHLHGHIHSSGGAYNEFNRKQGLLRYDVGCDANGHSPVSFDELREWFAGVDEPCGRVKWPWWVNETGDRQVERELAAYKREEVIR